MFKIRKKSNSTFKQTNQVNRYKCLKQIADVERHWKSLLENELQMGPTIIAFQNVEISMRVDAHKKLMLRETFMLKKQIIKLIIGEKYDEIIAKIQLLKSKSPTDYGLCILFQDFYHIRKSIIDRKHQYMQQTFKQIKLKIMQKYEKIEKQKNGILYGRIIYIAALHLIKLNGVLIKSEDISIVVQALNLKKKELCMAGCSINQLVLQSLLFLTFEFYKILYLLKRDQDLISQYYNQIRAYLSIFRTKCKGFQQFENSFKIEQKIDGMKPINLNLKIYDDHNRRRVLSLQNTEFELLKSHFVSQNITILSSQINNQIKKRPPTLMRYNSTESSFDKAEAQENKQHESALIVKQIIEMMHERQENNPQLDSSTDKFCFSFIKPYGQTMLTGKFFCRLASDFRQFRIQITLYKGQEIIGMHTFCLTEQQKFRNIAQYAKKLWRAIKEKFYTDKTQFLPNLFSFEYPPQIDLPKDINYYYQIPISVRIHEILLHYLRKNATMVKANGQIVPFPSSKECEKKQPGQQQQKIFAKRYGFISFNKKQKLALANKNSQQNVQNCINSLQIQNNDSISRITLLHKVDQCYEMINISIISNRIRNVLVFECHEGNNERKTNQYSKYFSKIIPLCFLMPRKRKFAIFQSQFYKYLHSEQYYFEQPSQDYLDNHKFMDKSIQEQFQVMKSPVLQTRQNSIKTYRYQNSNKNKFKFANRLNKKQNKENRKNTENKIKKTFKIQNKYKIFNQDCSKTLIKFSDFKYEFILTQKNQNCELEYKKFRLYKTIAFRQRQKEDKHRYRKVFCVRNKNQREDINIRMKQQKIQVKWVRTAILKHAGKYFYLNLFSFNCKMIANLYDIKLSKHYMGIWDCEAQDNSMGPPWSFDQQRFILNNQVILKQFQPSRNCICDAQQFLTVQDDCQNQ